MNERYVNITLAEMEEMLDSSKGWRKTQVGKEYAFEYQLKNHPWLVVKVCTGIKVNDNNSRSVGKDALRCFCVNTALNKGWISVKTTYRTTNWRDHLKERILQTITEAKQRR